MLRRMLGIGLAALMGSVWGAAQTAEVAARLGYPRMILYNAKVVTMDDASFESRVGTIAQAMAVREGKILAAGSNAEIRALAGPSTKLVDLKGRTVLPTFTSTHEHPNDWAFTEPRAILHALPKPDDLALFRWLPSLPPREQVGAFQSTMQEALSKARPGQWIVISFNQGPEYEWAPSIGAVFRNSIKKEFLDQLAPNNPVKIKNGFVGGVVNQKAIDALRGVHPALDVINGPAEVGDVGIFLKTGGGATRVMEPDVLLKGKVPVLASILKAEMEWWASWGITTFGSSPYSFSNLQALDYLDKKGEMPGRWAWGYSGPDFDLQVLRHLAAMLGHGTDHLWLIGAWERIGNDCMSIPLRKDAEKLAQERGWREGVCNFAPGTEGREILERIIETGNRIATLHTGGDKDIDYLMDAIEQASQRAGMTLDQIRAKRHAMDHSQGAPRLDQIPRMKKLGMVASLNNEYLWQPGGHASEIAEFYGSEYTSWIAPRKSFAEAGVMTGWEMDHPLPHKVFFFITKGMNRYHDSDQRVYGPDQKTDRIIQLKALTRWGAYYVLRENQMGSLEPGKFADFMVLDQDILTVPEDRIPSIRVLMTVVGGKTVHLASSLAGEVDMPAVGATTWKEQIPAGW